MKEKMNSKQRVLTAIRHEEPDRVPLNIWLYAPGIGSEELKSEVDAKYGSLDGFYDAFGIDFVTEILPFPYTGFVPGDRGTFFTGAGGVSAEEVIDEHLCDPDDEASYDGLRKLVELHGEDKAVVAHVWGVVEASYSFMGVEATLIDMTVKQEPMAELFRRLGRWSARVAENSLDLGADMIQISADAGSKTGMLFSPNTWREMVYPNDKRIADVARRQGKPVIMHNDGNIWEIMDGIVEMGVDVLHPVQTSAGMDLIEVKKKYGDRLTINGGLDVSQVLPLADEEELVATIRRYMEALKPGGGFIFNTEHFVPATTTLARLELAYLTALQSAWY